MRYTELQRYVINSKNPYFKKIVTHVEGSDMYFPLNALEDRFSLMKAMPAEFRTAWIVDEFKRTIWDDGFTTNEQFSCAYFKTEADAKAYLKRLPVTFSWQKWLNDRFYLRTGEHYKIYTKYSEPYQVLVRV